MICFPSSSQPLTELGETAGALGCVNSPEVGHQVVGLAQPRALSFAQLRRPYSLITLIDSLIHLHLEGPFQYAELVMNA